MSHDHINAARAAVKLFSLAPLPAHVAIVLASHADDDGWCWPSIPTLVDETGHHRYRIEEAIVALEAAGLEVKRRPGMGTRYRIPAAWVTAWRASISTTPRRERGVHNPQPRARGADPRARGAGYPAPEARVTDKRTDQVTDAPRTPFEILARCPNRTGWKNFCDESCERCRGSGHVHTDAVRPQTASSTRRFRRRA